MKKGMLKKSYLFMLIITLSIAGLLADVDYDINFNQPQSSTYQLNFNVNDYQILETVKNETTYSKIDFAGRVNLSKKGYAELPYLNATVQLKNKNVDIEIIPGEYTELKLEHPLLPSRGIIYRNQDPAAIPFQIDPQAVVDEFYPGKLAETSEPFIIRDIRGTSVYVYPFQYNAATNVLRVYHNLQIKLIENNTAPINPLVKSDRFIAREMSNIYNTAFINHNMDRFDNELQELGSILVIRTARDAEAIAPYIEWKRQKGHIVYEEEVPAGSYIQSIIQEQYNLHNDILYVQLVGDWDDLRSPLNADDSPLDPKLGCVAGDDIYPDVIISRFSGNDANQVSIQVNKTINYEKYPDNGGDWYHRGLGIGSELGSGSGDDAEADYMHIDIIKKNKLLPFNYTQIDNAYLFPPKEKVSTPVNNGLSIINYTGHGCTSGWITSGFDNNDVNNLTNGNKLPFIWSVACVNGKFNEEDDCFAEAWLKKENGGAIAMYASAINQSWVAPMRGQDYMNDLLIGGYDYSHNPGDGINVEVQKTTFGSLSLNGSILMCLEEPETGQDIIETWTIFGDASLQVRTDTPAEITLSNKTLLTGLDYTTTVYVGDTKQKDAVITLIQDGNIYKGISDESGNITISHELTEGTCTMIATAYNGLTLIEELEVTQAVGPYCTVKDYTFNDDNNNIPEYNEEGTLDITLNNIGTEPAENIELTLSTESDYITITDHTETLANIGANSSIALDQAFSFQISDNIPDQQLIHFNVEISGSTTWNSEFAISINAPAFEIKDMIIYDANNSILEPGENAKLKIPVTNIGHSSAPAGIATLISNNENITIFNSDINLDELQQGNTTVLEFEINVSEDAEYGSLGFFSFLLNSGSYRVNRSFFTTLGNLKEDFESGDFSAFDWENGDPGWQVVSRTDNPDTYYAQSVDIIDGQTATLSITVGVPANSQISFWKKVSCEASDNGVWDHFAFFINGIEQQRWWGEDDWTNEKFDVPSGLVTFEWKYVKDEVYTTGADCAWIDDISFPNMTEINLTPTINISEESMDFGEVAIDEKVTKPLIISNTSVSDLGCSISVSDNFSISINEDEPGARDMDYTLKPYSSLTVYVTFEPTETIEYTGDVSIFSTDPQKPVINIPISGNGIISSTNNEIPAITALNGNYPNPFNPTTTISFNLSTAENTDLVIYNIKGQKVKTLINQKLEAGSHSLIWNGTDNNGRSVASGIYFCRMKAGKVINLKKMVLMK